MYSNVMNVSMQRRKSSQGHITIEPSLLTKRHLYNLLTKAKRLSRLEKGSEHR